MSSDAEAKRKAVLQMAQDFYRVMPGAPPVPLTADGWMWGEIEHTDHFQFCHLIAERIVRWSGVQVKAMD